MDRQREGYQPNDQYTTQDQATDSQQEPENADSELSRQWQRMMCSEPRSCPNVQFVERLCNRQFQLLYIVIFA